MKKVLITIMIAAVATVFGCSAKERKELINNSSLESIPKKITESIDENLIIDAEVNVTLSENFNVYNAKYKTYDENKFFDLLMSGEEIVSKYENENSNSLSDRDIVINTDDKSINIHKEGMHFRTSEARKILSLISGVDGYFSKDIENDFPKSSLENLNKEECINKVKTIFEGLELDLSDNIIIYSLDKSSLNELENSSMTDEEYAEWEKIKPGDGKKIWTEDDEAYLIIFNFEINNIPIYSEDVNMMSANLILPGTQIHAVVNKNGLVMLGAYSIYESISMELENKSCIDYKDALEVVKNKYKNIILTNENKITNISLQYVPKSISESSLEVALTPAWIFNIETEQSFKDDIKGESVITINSTIIVDAVTGEEIK